MSFYWVFPTFWNLQNSYCCWRSVELCKRCAFHLPHVYIVYTLPRLFFNVVSRLHFYFNITLKANGSGESWMVFPGYLFLWYPLSTFWNVFAFFLFEFNFDFFNYFSSFFFCFVVVVFFGLKSPIPNIQVCLSQGHNIYSRGHNTVSMWGQYNIHDTYIRFDSMLWKLLRNNFLFLFLLGKP